MIIISAGAGLGNQMFEYAFYLAMKDRYPNTKVCIDPDYAFVSAHNGYEVEEIFGLRSDRAGIKDIDRIGDVAYLANAESYGSLFSKLRRKLKLKKASFLMQKDFTEFYPEYLDLDSGKSWYLFGPFANYKYFDDIKEIVTQAFIFPEIDEKNRQKAELIMNSTSVSVHVRRGDYVEQGVKTLDREFYDAAVNLICRETGKCEEEITLFVFSDDGDYVKRLFDDKKKVVFVGGNTGKNSFRDMQLMSLCQHNIIADSTFSFWGAYLNRNPDKIVIGPDRPFKGFKNPFSCDDWIRLKV
ncbi:MAG: alpha-1,2-fucosyltransferase [Lachnospiraceae bacterium]|nr:alpha-1,2-fucosyltransferase [Lachnospiraceae bacterium]